MTVSTETATEYSHISRFTITTEDENNDIERFNAVSISAITIAGVGIIANSTVIVAFTNNRKLRNKIPNIFIVNQVGRRCWKCIYLFSFMYRNSTLDKLYVYTGK